MSKSILIVDDEQIIRNVLKRKLEQNTQYTVYTADDGEPGLEIFRQQPIDLVSSSESSEMIFISSAIESCS